MPSTSSAAAPFWFHRMVEYWTLPTHLDLPELVRRARLQLVQAGTFGPMFYGLADDPAVDRHWVGMPLVGIQANLELAARTIAGVQAAGARFVGQFSMSWHYGDHETGRGLFGVWDHVWSPELLGPAPCPDPAAAMERVPGGALRCWPIEGRPYRTYSGCFCNPLWLATLEGMVSHAIALGVDGLMAHHNFSTFCACEHCRAYLLPRLGAAFTPGELDELYSGDPGAADLRTPAPGAPPELQQRLRSTLERWVHQRRKEAFDQVLLQHGRQLKPDLLVAQWYHKYDFGPQDERSLLPPEEWARDESYIWYSQGGNKGESCLDQGYLADMGLPARFVHAAGGGRPFVINKYDYRRLRLSIAEAAANGAAALAFHVPQDVDAGDATAREEYQAILARYHGFLAAGESLYHPAAPWARVALVYPRRDEVQAEKDCLDALHRVGRVLEDAHVLFDIVLDEQLASCCHRYRAVIVPRPGRLTSAERARLRQYAAREGLLVLLEGGGDELLPSSSPAGSGQVGGRGGGVVRLSAWPWAGEPVELRPGVRVPGWPAPEADAVGRELLRLLQEAGASPLRTDAPWYVRVRAWRSGGDRLALHWVNYRQVESAATEVPWPVGPLRADCALPDGTRVAAVHLRSPELAEATPLPFTQRGGHVEFVVPQLVVYAVCVLQMTGNAHQEKRSRCGY